MQLYIIRHGESANNALVGENFDYETYLASRSPDPVLTAVGQRQAERVAEYLAANDCGIEELHCSAMVRAMQTAAPIGQALGLKPRVWLDIHEHGGLFLGNPRNGDLQIFPGISRQEAEAQFPGYQLPETLDEEGWYRSGYEEIGACEARASRVAKALYARADAEPDAVLAIVSHGTFLDRLLKALFAQTETNRHYYHLNNTSLTRLDFSTKGHVVLRFANRVEHLSPEMVTE